jgi:hypothetical protein
MSRLRILAILSILLVGPFTFFGNVNVSDGACCIVVFNPVPSINVGIPVQVEVLCHYDN